MVSYTYPKTDDQNTSLYVAFTAHQLTAAAIVDWNIKKIINSETAVNNTTEKEAKGTIVLALPSSTLTESFSANWSVSNLVSGLTNSSGGQLVQMVTGVMVPPIYKAMYSDSTPRTYNFNFSFLPKNKDEENEIVNIIQTLKAWGCPGALASESQAGDTSYMDKVVPYVIQIQFIQGAKKLDELIKPQFSVIENISVNYFDNGQITAYESGMPKSISLNLSLKEITICVRDDFIREQKK